MEVFQSIHRLYWLTNKKLDRELRSQFGIVFSEWILLNHLKNDLSQQGEIVQRMGLSAASVTHIVEKLAKRGLISTAISESDRRQRKLTLTTKGEALLRAVQSEITTLANTILGSDYAKLDELIKKVLV